MEETTKIINKFNKKQKKSTVSCESIIGEDVNENPGNINLTQSDSNIQVNGESEQNIELLNKPICSISSGNLIENDSSKGGISRFTRNSTNRLRDSRRCHANRQKLTRNTVNNYSIKKSNSKEHSIVQSHLRNISSHISKNNFMKSSPKSTLRRLSSSVSSLIEGKYTFTVSTLSKNKKKLKETKNDLFLLTNFSVSPYHRSNTVRSSLKKDEKSDEFVDIKLSASFDEVNEKTDEIIDDNINYAFKVFNKNDNTLTVSTMDPEDRRKKSISNISKSLGGAIKTSSLINIQSIEENSIIQGLSSDTKQAIPNMWSKNFFFGRKKNTKKIIKKIPSNEMKAENDKERADEVLSTNDQGTNKTNLLVKSLTDPTNSTYLGEDNTQDPSYTFLSKEEQFSTSESAFCDSSTVTNVPLHNLFIGSSSVCFQADLTASQESGNKKQKNQPKPNPPSETEKNFSLLNIMSTLLTASKESDLEKILKCDTKRKPFQNFLEQQFCVENLNFYLAVEEYRKIPDEELTRRKAVGLQIFERHFITHSAEPVNIDNSTNRTIKDAVLAGKFTCDLYDVAQYQIFHLLKYDCWPRYLRAASAEDKDALGLEDSSDNYSKKHSDSAKDSAELQRSFRQTQEVDKFCTLLSNDGCSSERICLRDPRESVAKWIANIATSHGMDKFASEVVDAQTGSTIDPARQAVDALHNRCVRLVSVVFVTVEFLSPNATVKSSTPPQPARVVTVKARHSLTIGSAIRPLFAKYMIDPTQTAICFCGGVDQVPPRTQLGSIPPRKLTVMTYQQLQERQQMPKKELQKLDINASPNMSQKDQNLPFHQHGDVAFYVQPMDNDGKGHKHSAIRSNSSNPRSEGSSTSESIMSRFRRKASQAVGSKDSDQNNYQNNSLKPSNKLSDTKSTVTHTRSGIATNNSQNKGAGGRKISTPKIDNSSKKAVISSIDVPYCGENQKADEAFIIQKNELLKEEEELKKKKENKEVEVSGLSGSQGTNGNLARVPAIYTSAIRSDKEPVSSSNCPETTSNLGWQPADYV
uniref:Regulator of G-protein signaling rgs-6 (inferred by orthology to a C. elegans protein) n=1 Tax=Strongyloides venezuelensis TaxID=75913 RepID=A0A0K0G4U9_STRVS